MEKYVINGGFQGLGDRLQCLSYCIAFAIKHNRILKINWEDRTWNSDFHQYFDLVGVPYTTKTIDFKGKSVQPSIWEALGDRAPHDWVWELKVDKIDDYTADVVVHGGVGYRVFNMWYICQHLRIKPEIIDMIDYGPLPVVHLRGTDRLYQSKNLAEIFEKSGPARVLSDDQRLVDEWLKLSPDSIVLTSGRPDFKPMHYFGEDVYERNCKAIADFMTIALAEKAYSNNDTGESPSLYYTMARSLDNPKLMLGVAPDIKEKSVEYLIREA